MRATLACLAVMSLATTAIAQPPAAPSPAPPPEKRCGWINNPTPGNWWLIDRAGEWTMGEQGGYQAPGLDDLPDMSAKGQVNTNGPHGYSCGCLTVSTNRATMRITRIYSGYPQPLSVCRADKGLKRPS